MSKFLHTSAWRAGLVVLGCLLAAGAAAASGTGVAKTAATPPPVDHQLCYSAAGTATGAFRIPPNLILINQFNPNGFLLKIPATPVFHCNPVMKIVDTPNGLQTYKVTNPNAHLVCFPAKASTAATAQATHKVSVQNQFGQAVLQTKAPNLFCVPSWKSLTGPPNKKPTTPRGLNHFTCYPVTEPVGQEGYKPPPVMLQDEFTQKPVQAVVNPVPAELCLPTAKIVPTANGAKFFPILNPTLHLLCFPVSKTPFRPSVYDENQFGTRKLAIRATKWLCLPSTKRVLS
jgi:hypothetical protein